MVFQDPIAGALGALFSDVTVVSILVRVALSLIFSAVIGCERASKRHAAGLRTFMLVSLAATVAAIIDCYVGFKVPVLSAAVVISVAILSANSILFSSRSQIKGLTTSVGLWASGLLGIAVGAGLYTVSLICFVALTFSLAWFPSLERYLKNRSNHFEVHLELKDISFLQDFVSTIRKLGLKIDDIEQNPAYLHSGLSVYSVAISISSEELKKYKTHTEIISALSTLEYIYHIEEMT